MPQDGRLIIANPHGFCAGVRRAVDAIEKALRLYPHPVHCLNEIVHNRQVVERLKSLGVVFVRDIGDVPAGQPVMLSAHGVSPSVHKAAASRGLRVIDATCPFVHKVHREVLSYAARGYTILLIGHPTHDEIVGVRGEAPESVIVVRDREAAQCVTVPDPDRVAVVTQTTLSVAETEHVMSVLRERFPRLQTPPKSDICRATTSRQDAVKALVPVVEILLVLGSANSSNTQRLAEVARAGGATAVLIESLSALDSVDLAGVKTIGLTAGASTPEAYVGSVVAVLKAKGFPTVENVRAYEEPVQFRLPAGLEAPERGDGAPRLQCGS